MQEEIWFFLTKPERYAYNIQKQSNISLTRGCTGFDGGCAAVEAIGGS